MKYDVQFFLTVWKYAEDAESISEFLNLTPDSVLRKNTEGKVPRQNTWIIKSNPPSDKAPLDAHWANMMEKMSGKAALLKELSPRAEVVFTLWVANLLSRPTLVLSAECIEFMAESGARFEVDYQ